MKYSQNERSRLIFMSSRACLFILLTLTNLFVTTESYASGAKRPEIDDGTGTPITTPINDDGNTEALPEDDDTPLTSESSFNAPWKNGGSTIIIDAYEGNSIDWNKMATDKKVVAVIHRSSIGTRVDTQYVARKKIALERGYLWGAYHLGNRGNTIAQADLFLSLVKNELDTLMVLDLENTSASNFMSIEEAVIFMDYIYEKTGKIPTVYANHSVTMALNQKLKSNIIFKQAKLWYARFKSTISDFPIGIWDNYFLWQFSSEINCTSTGTCLYNVPGTKFDMDVNVFHGSRRELESKWNND